MRALLYQPSAGISGDMHLGALVDLGVPEAYLADQLARLPVAGEFRVSFARASKQGISGTRARVTMAELPQGRHASADTAGHAGAHAHPYSPPRGHGHAHTDEHEHTDGARHAHSGQRDYRAIRALISVAGFAPGIERRAQAIFREIALAEAKIHDVPIDQVHFHEVGAIDSIVDIVGAAICLDYLAVERIYTDVIEVGSGFVECAHGRYPVPAPATQEILAGMPCRYGGVEGESTTPTGAAILKACVDEASLPGTFVPERVGYGIGVKDFHIPNVLRVVLGDAGEVARARTLHCKIEANIDDMSPEAYEPLIEHLLELGASDVYFAPIVMKKSRPATCLSVLCETDRADALADAIFNRSTTIGLRILPFEKRVLPRTERDVATSLGVVRIKVVTQPDGIERWKSEYEDVRRLAAAHGTDYLNAKRIIDADVARAMEPGPPGPRE